jgi:hypothetical protein
MGEPMPPRNAYLGLSKRSAIEMPFERLITQKTAAGLRYRFQDVVAVLRHGKK